MCYNKFFSKELSLFVKHCISKCRRFHLEWALNSFTNAIELFVTIFNGFKPLTVVASNDIFNDGFLNLDLWQAFSCLLLCVSVWLVFIRNYHRLLESIQSKCNILNQNKFFLNWSIFNAFPFLMIIQQNSYSLLKFCQRRKIYISYKDVKHVWKGNFIIFLTLRNARFRN